MPHMVVIMTLFFLPILDICTSLMVCQESGSVWSTSYSGLFEISHDSTATGAPSDCNRETAPYSHNPLLLCYETEPLLTFLFALQ